MITVDLSNIWSRISLPDLLERERDLFDAHLRLRSNSDSEPAFCGWLGAPDAQTAKMLNSVKKAAEHIRSGSQVLIVVGVGGSFAAARAGVQLLSGHDPEAPQILFAGCDLCSRAWLSLCRELGQKDISLHIIEPDGSQIEPAIASRAIRWMLERRYGSEAKKRVCISALPDSPFAVMAQEEGYTLLPLPTDPGGADSGLSSAALLPMAVAGIDPLSVLEGAAEAYGQMDVRAFENPAWLYAGARICLKDSGCAAELLETFDPSYDLFGRWWRQTVLAKSCGLLPIHAPMTEELDAWDGVLDGGSPVFETLLKTDNSSIRKVNVEMDWKDYDGLGYLAEHTLEDAAQATSEALVAVHGDLGIPVVILQTGAMDAPQFGELIYFLELSAALCAAVSGAELTEPAKKRVRSEAERLLGKPQEGSF